MFVLVTAATLLGIFLLAEGEDVDARSPWAVPLAAWWLTPLVLYWVAVRTVVASWLFGVALLAATLAGVIVVYRTESSTAAVGLFTVPPLVFVAALAAVLVERLVLRVAES